MVRILDQLVLISICLFLIGCTASAVSPSPAITSVVQPTLSTPPTRTPYPSPTSTPEVATVMVDPSVAYQTMDGIGANSYAFPYANDLGWNWETVKFVFDELDIAYIRLAPWLGWWETFNDNDDPTVINWDGFGTVHDIINHHDLPYAQFLHARGIELGVGVWDFAGVSQWCETCVDWLAQGKPRQIPPELYPEMAESISAYILHLKNNGVPLAFAEVQNEPDIEAGIKYPSPEALREAGRALVEAFDHFGLEVVLHAPNLHSPNDNVRWIEVWFSDEVLRERTAAVSYHTWWSRDPKTYDAIWKSAQKYGKPVWATEVGYQEAGSAIDPSTWRTAWEYAKAHYYAIAWSHASRTYIWTLLGNDAAVGKNGERYPMFYVLKRFANTIPAGAVLLSSHTDDNRLFSLAFRRPDGSYALIVLNDNRATRIFRVMGLDASAVQVTVTSEKTCEETIDPAQVNRPDGLQVTLPPLSLVSIELRP